MKYIGWIVSLILVVMFYIGYKTQYLPLKEDVEKLNKEIAMWENVLKNEKGLGSDRNRFAIDRFFENDRLTPYAEVEILRRFDPYHKGIELYISAPKALTRAYDVVRFLAEQRIEYESIYCIFEIDSLEKFEYKFVK